MPDAQENGIPPPQNEDPRETVNSSASEEDDRARVLSDWEGEGGASDTEKKPIIPQRSLAKLAVWG